MIYLIRQMRSKAKEILKQRAGFTLIEIIIAVGILSILTGLTAVGVYGYLSSAYTTRVNETAKTVFYAAQNYLLEQKKMGQLTDFCLEADAYGSPMTWDELKEILQENLGSEFNEADYKDKFSSESTGYIKMPKGSTNSNPLYRIVEEYTKDTKLLANTFLLEYDRKTGVVRSVFYSEQTDDFSYSGDRTGNANVILRSIDALRQKKQGYYGVSITGNKPVSEIYIESAADVLLINGERLYLQWNDTNDTNPEFVMQPALLDALIYDVTVSRLQTDGVSYEELFTISNIEVGNRSLSTTLNQADDNGFSTNGYRLAYDSATRTHQLILDDVHHSLFEEYKVDAGNHPNVEVLQPAKAEDILVCEITTRLDEVMTGLEAESFSSLSNYQSAAYAGGDATVTNVDGIVHDVYGSGKLETGESSLPFGIMNARHLNNMRYMQNVKETSAFEQRASIDWKQAEGRALSKPFLTLTYTNPFQGSYKVLASNPGYYSISNLSIQQPEQFFVGMFHQNMGVIDGLQLVNPTISGKMYVGCVAGVNAGELNNIKITGATVTASHIAGGIVGYQTPIGSMHTITSESSVEGIKPLTARTEDGQLGIFDVASKGRYVGGIAGLNKGEATNIIAGVQNQTKVVGTSYVGGAFGMNDVVATLETRNITNYNAVTVSSQPNASEALSYFGGMVGYQGLGGLIDGTNYGLLDLTFPSTREKDSILYIGGIAGQNAGLIENCKQIGTNNKVIEIQNQCVNALKAGKLPDYSGKYVGGIVGENLDTGIVRKVTSENTAVAGYSLVGGLVGKNAGEVSQSGFATAQKGVVVASNYLVGGVFGYNSSKTTTGYTNQANVFGKGMVGGITGFHGVLGANGEQEILAYMNTLAFDDSPTYYDKLLRIEEILKPGSGSTIMDCMNQGFVYALDAFGGGITGANYGSIKASNVQKGAAYAFTELHTKGSADCIGGVSGYNGKGGIINGEKVVKQTADVEIIADDFVGGIVGLNAGTIEGYMYVEGGVFAKGDCVGGVIGMNTNASAISQLTISRTENITGAYFVGGVLGCNLSLENKGDTTFTSVHTEKGAIQGTAFVGGIVGYNALIPEGTSIGNLFASNGELTLLKANAFKQLPPEVVVGSTIKTVYKNCNNKAKIKADRYVGGIVGFNSPKARLWIASCSNTGILEIADASKTSPVIENGKDVYYYYIGGITGKNSENGVIHNCINDGTVKSPSTYLGGICEVNEGYVQFCATGTAEDAGSIGGSTDNNANSIGGIVGLNEKIGKVVSCRADQYAKIKGGNDTGGLVGTNAAGGVITSNILGTEAIDVSAIQEYPISSGDKSISYCSAVVIGKNNTGGIVGYNEGLVEHIKVEKKASITGDTNVGGFVGYNVLGAVLGSNDQVIMNLTNYASVYGNHEVGGIVGKHEGSGITNCINAGLVEAIGDTKGYAGGITGSVTSKMTIQDCTNYGTVVSQKSFAGGIVGINNGILTKNNNFGSVEGSSIFKSITTSGETAEGTAIGGIVGCNMPNGQVADCASRTRKDDVNGALNNPFYANTEPNKIKGAYMVGGIIGYHMKTTSSNSKFLNTTDLSREVTITIEAKEVVIEKGQRSRIGGFIGNHTYNPSPETLENYIFSGEILVGSIAATNQQNIGGIIGYQHANITLRNCYFKGKILGAGNNPNSDDNGGIGGLAGNANGNIIVHPSQVDGVTVYTSTAQGARVEGAKRVGGVVGEVGSNFRVWLQVNGSDVLLDDLSNIYYENYAIVQGGKSVGGFYGSADQNTNLLKNLRNRGNILPLDTNGKMNLGGIAGKTQADIVSCQNYGNIGDQEDSAITMNVGGLIGNWDGNRQKTASDAKNFGVIYAGKASIGGLFGTTANARIAATCQNEADIYVNYNNKGTVSGVGGIVGTTSGTTRIEAVNPDTSMNLANKEIRIRGKASGVGGIVGSSKNDLIIKNIINLSPIREEAGMNANNGSDVRVAGILGTATDSIQLDTCTNKGEISLGASDEIGGLFGGADATHLKLELSIQNGKNDATIIGRTKVGGIVGGLTKVVTKAFTGNENNGLIQGRTSVGGIIGLVQNGNGRFEKSSNKGMIQAIRDKGGNGTVDGIAGGIGRITGDKNLSIVEFENLAQIEAKQAQGVTNVTNIGGIVGEMSGGGLSINNSKNKGNITLVIAPGSRAYAVGGVCGAARYASFIGDQDSEDVRTTNSGELLISGGNSLYEIGGIVGFVQLNSKIMHSSNTANVLADKKTAYDVGGIAGKSYGVLYSCQTEKTVRVTARSNVGGILGRACNYTSKVTSTGRGVAGRSGYDLSYSAASVEGSEAVGGVVGHQQEGTIYNVLVTADAKIVLEEIGKPVNAAGGIVGYSGVAENGQFTTKGVVASCYSMATVTGVDTANQQPYIGGIIGYRLHMDKDAATSITDGFVVFPSKIDATQPPFEGVGTVAQKAWAVGNEPFVETGGGTGTIFNDPRDRQTASAGNSPLDTADKFMWSQDSYDALCDSLGITDKKPYDSLEAIQGVMHKYDGFQLPPPDLYPVRSEYGFRYTHEFRPLAGFYVKYGFKLYEGEYTVGDKIPDNAKLLLDNPIDIDIGNAMKTITVDLQGIKVIDIKKYVGKTISVATYAKGYSLGDVGEGLNYTKDSDVVVMQQFVVLPPLVTPQVKPLDTTEADSDFFDAQGKQIKIRLEIENWSDYKKSAAEYYASLTGITDDKLATSGLYDAMLNGVFQFTMTDGFNATNVSTIDNSYKAVHNIVEKSQIANATDPYYEVVTEAGVEKAYIILDYSGLKLYQDNFSTRPWHAFHIQAVTFANHKSLSIDPRNPGFKYRYSDSYFHTGKNYRLKTKFFSPIDLKVDYVGKTDPDVEPETPSYQFSWKRNGAADSEVSGYQVELVYLLINKGGVETKIDLTQLADYANAPYTQKALGATNTKLTLTKAQLNQVLANYVDASITPGTPWWEHPVTYKLAYQVKTLSANPAANIDSDASASLEFPLVKRQEPVKDIVVAKSTTNNTKLEITWVDDAFNAVDLPKNEYEVKYELIVNGVSRGEKTGKAAGACKLENIDIPTDLTDKPFMVKMSVRKLGEQGQTLHANWIEAQQLIGKRLDKPNNFSHTGEKIAANAAGVRSLYVNFTWDNTGTSATTEKITADNCSGYQIEVVLNKSGAEDAPLVYTVAGFDTKEYALDIPLDGVTQVQFAIKALGIFPKAESSEFEKMTKVISATQANMPNLTGATVGGKVVYPVPTPPVALTREEYAKPLVETLTLEVVETGALGQKVELKKGADSLWSGDETNTTGSFTISPDPTGLTIAAAGEEVSVLAYNKTGDIATLLPSEVGTASFLMPRIYLDQPKIDVFAWKKEQDVTDPVNPVDYLLFTAMGSQFATVTDTEIQKEEAEQRKGIRYEILQNGTPVEFIPYKADGTPANATTAMPGGEPVTSWEIEESKISGYAIEIYFRMKTEIPTADMAQYVLQVSNTAKTEATNTKYVDSAKESKGLDSAIETTAVILNDLMQETPVEELPMEDTTVSGNEVESEDTEKPSDTVEPSDTEEPSDAEKPSDSEKPDSSDLEVTPPTSEPPVAPTVPEAPQVPEAVLPKPPIADDDGDTVSE